MASPYWFYLSDNEEIGDLPVQDHQHTQRRDILDAETEEIVYNTNGMPDISANEMYHSATASGPIDTIPETPGLAVWHDGHIGVYIGNGEVVEAMGTRYGVVKTKLEGARWTHWLKIPYISYD